MKHKFGAVRTKVDEKSFSSKLEAAYYKKLKNLQESKIVLFFLMQVPFLLPGKITYRLDFMVFYAPKNEELTGDIEFVETKGFMTPDARIKLAQVQEIYNIEIKVVQKV